MKTALEPYFPNKRARIRPAESSATERGARRVTSQISARQAAPCDMRQTDPPARTSFHNVRRGAPQGPRAKPKAGEDLRAPKRRKSTCDARSHCRFDPPLPRHRHTRASDMDIFADLRMGVLVAISPINIVYLLIGAVVGMIVGGNLGFGPSAGPVAGDLRNGSDGRHRDAGGPIPWRTLRWHDHLHPAEHPRRKRLGRRYL